MKAMTMDQTRRLITGLYYQAGAALIHSEDPAVPLFNRGIWYGRALANSEAADALLAAATGREVGDLHVERERARETAVLARLARRIGAPGLYERARMRWTRGFGKEVGEMRIGETPRNAAEAEGATVLFDVNEHAVAVELNGAVYVIDGTGPMPWMVMVITPDEIAETLEDWEEATP